MAAGRSVVSTAVGAEGLLIHPSRDILLADDPETFSDACLSLLEHPGRRQALAAAALEMVSANFSWERIVTRFEEILRRV
jgi:glycosyltransferase involved in cell wall biosynthesis